jgi:hypothetical protein
MTIQSSIRPCILSISFLLVLAVTGYNHFAKTVTAQGNCQTYNVEYARKQTNARTGRLKIHNDTDKKVKLALYSPDGNGTPFEDGLFDPAPLSSPIYSDAGKLMVISGNWGVRIGQGCVQLIGNVAALERDKDGDFFRVQISRVGNASSFGLGTAPGTLIISPDSGLPKTPSAVKAPSPSTDISSSSSSSQSLNDLASGAFQLEMDNPNNKEIKGTIKLTLEEDGGDITGQVLTSNRARYKAEGVVWTTKNGRIRMNLKYASPGNVQSFELTYDQRFKTWEGTLHNTWNGSTGNAIMTKLRS